MYYFGYYSTPKSARIEQVTSPLEIQEPKIGSEADLEITPDTPWVVIVWNDPINLMSYVAYVFQELFGYSEAKSNKLMLDVHHKGRASVFTGEKAESERYVHKLHGYGLWATMEQD